MALLKIKCKKCLDTGFQWDPNLDDIISCNCSGDEEDDDSMEELDNLDLIDLEEEEED